MWLEKALILEQFPDTLMGKTVKYVIENPSQEVANLLIRQINLMLRKPRMGEQFKEALVDAGKLLEHDYDLS